MDGIPDWVFSDVRGGACAAVNRSLSIDAVVRRTFGVYTGQAPRLLGATLLVAGVVAFDQARIGHPIALAIAVALINLLALGLFVCLVVLLAADVWDCGACRDFGKLLRGAWSAVGRLLLIGAVTGLTITLVTSVASVIVASVALGILLGSGTGVAGLVFGLLLLPILLLVPELLLLTVWSVVAPVAVLERPRGLRALGRSRALVRGNGWRVLGAILLFALPLSFLVTAGDHVAQVAGGGAAIALRLLLAVVVAPVPVLAATALYFELRRSEPAAVSAEPIAPDILSPEAGLL